VTPYKRCYIQYNKPITEAKRKAFTLMLGLIGLNRRIIVMKKTTKLTDTQRDFAAENHDLVYQFLRARRLPEDEYYDIVVFGYLRAVKIYDQQPELRQHTFKTIAFKRMFAVLWNHYRSLYAAKRNATVLSLNSPAKQGGELQEYIASPGSAVHEYAEARENWEAIRPVITPKQMQALDMRAQGYTNREIGKVYYLTPGAVSSRMYRLRKKTGQLAA